MAGGGRLRREIYPEILTFYENYIKLNNGENKIRKSYEGGYRMSFVLETRSLVKDYGGKIALSGIDLALPAGKIIGLLGSNGSGKTTTFEIGGGTFAADKRGNQGL